MIAKKEANVNKTADRNGLLLHRGRGIKIIS